MSEGVTPKRSVDLRSRYSIPTTDSNLPTKIEVRPEAVGIHSSWARSTSMKSPSENSRPERGMKSTLAVAIALRATAASRRRLTSLTMKLGAPVESMLSNRFTPGRFPRLAGSPREFTAGASRSPRKTHAYSLASCGNARFGPTSDDAHAGPLRDEEAEVHVTRDGHDRPAEGRDVARLVQARLEVQHLLVQIFDGDRFLVGSGFGVGGAPAGASSWNGWRRGELRAGGAGGRQDQQAAGPQPAFHCPGLASAGA